MATKDESNGGNRFNQYDQDEDGFTATVDEGRARQPTTGMGEQAGNERDAELKALMMKLDAFGQSLAKTRSQAIADRQTSGIEDIWREDEEFYEGIDELNRYDERVIQRTKPSPGTSNALPNRIPNRSRVFPNITGPYVDSAAAHIADILIPTEDPPWKVERTPVPEIDELADLFVQQQTGQQNRPDKKGNWLARIKQLISGSAQDRTAAMETAAPTGIPPEEAFRQKQLGDAIASATGERIWDWQVECQWNAEARAVIEDAAKIGTGVLKGPVPKNIKSVRWVPPKQEERSGVPIEVPGHLQLVNKIKPVSNRVDPWNFYPHGAAGSNIQNGAYTWERDFITKKQLREMAEGEENPLIKAQIMMCLNEGPMRATAQIVESPEIATDLQLQEKYERWTYYGTAERDDLEAMGVDLEGIEDPHIFTMAILVNNRCIKAELPAIDHGGFPYDVFCWRKRKNYWAGIGVSRQIRVAQKIVVGATRTMMDNAGLAGGPMIVFKQGVVRPADGVAGIGPRKVFYIATNDTTITDATKAIGSVKVDMLVNELMTIINFGLKIAEDTSGFPMLMQGQMGSAPDRVGIANIMDRNTNAIKRRLARAFSDDVTGPHIRRYVIWHQMYGPDNEKGGDLTVNVKGYAALVEREIQNQQLPALINISLDPRFGLDPRKIIKELLRSWHLNPDTLEIDDEQWEELLGKWQELMAAAANGADPRVTVAQIQQQTRLLERRMIGEIEGGIAIANNQHDAEQREMDRQIKLLEPAFAKQQKLLEQAGVSADLIKKLKTDLAREVMKIQSQERLVKMKAPADSLPKPPTEPAGRAKPGESFQS